MDRRKFIKASAGFGALAGLPLTGPGLVFGSPQGRKGGVTRDVLIIVFQRGGADGLNLVVPYNESNYYASRPSVAIPGPGQTGGVLDLDGFFGLHPQLAAFQPLYNTGDLAIVHAAGSPSDSRSHFDAQDFMESGVDQKGLVFEGWLNRHLQNLSSGNDSPFRAVGLGTSLPLSLQGQVPTVGVAELADYGLVAPDAELPAVREAILQLFDQGSGIDSVANGILASVDLLAAADPLAIPTQNGAVYPETNFGLQMSQLAKLIRADVGLEIAAVDLGGWDHHDQETDVLGDLCSNLSDSLAAFHTDMGAEMADVTLLTMTEFGRRVAENASEGTDHGHGSVMFLLGGGVNGGQVFSDWPGLSPADLNRGDLEVSTDFRSVLGEALLKRVNPAEDLGFVFPGYDGLVDNGLFVARAS